MEHLKPGDTIHVRIGNNSLPAFVIYNGHKFYEPLEKLVTDIIFKSRKEWCYIPSCSKQMYGGDGKRMVLVEKTLKFFKET
jgi:hypothetical protein